MKGFFTAFLMAMSMFCAVPCPCPRWDEAQRGRMLLCLPLVGAVVGALWALAAWLLLLVSCPRPVAAAVLTAMPWLLTGFIHLDGFLDCSDAILSRRDLETRRKILKDSHVGSFAVIAMVLLALFSYACFSAADLRGKLPALLLIPAVTRACSAAAVLRLTPMGTSSYSAMTRDHSGSIAMAALAAALCVLSVVLCGLPGLSGAAAMIGAFAMIFAGVRQLGGMSGDISGLAVTVGEVCGVAVLALV